MSCCDKVSVTCPQLFLQVIIFAFEVAFLLHLALMGIGNTFPLANTHNPIDNIKNPADLARKFL